MCWVGRLLAIEIVRCKRNGVRGCGCEVNLLLVGVLLKHSRDGPIRLAAGLVIDEVIFGIGRVELGQGSVL